MVRIFGRTPFQTEWKAGGMSRESIPRTEGRYRADNAIAYPTGNSANKCGSTDRFASLVSFRRILNHPNRPNGTGNP